MSFSSGAFNRMPFNRPYSVDIFGNFEILVGGEALFQSSVELTASFTIDAEVEPSIDAIRERFGKFLIEQLIEMDFAGIRYRYGDFELVCDLEVQVNANRNHVDELILTGPFAPGEKIIIDVSKLLVKKNGNVIGYDGEIFELNPGNNRLLYKDNSTPETSRSIQIRVSHRDRFI